MLLSAYRWGKFLFDLLNRLGHFLIFSILGLRLKQEKKTNGIGSKEPSSCSLRRLKNDILVSHHHGGAKILRKEMASA